MINDWNDVKSSGVHFYRCWRLLFNLQKSVQLATVTNWLKVGGWAFALPCHTGLPHHSQRARTCMQSRTCTNMFRHALSNTDLHMHTRTTDVHKHVQTYTQTFTDMHVRETFTDTNLSTYAVTFTCRISHIRMDLYRLAHTCTNFHRLAQTCKDYEILDTLQLSLAGKCTPKPGHWSCYLNLTYRGRYFHNNEHPNYVFKYHSSC